MVGIAVEVRVDLAGKGVRVLVDVTVGRGVKVAVGRSVEVGRVVDVGRGVSVLVTVAGIDVGVTVGKGVRVLV